MSRDIIESNTHVKYLLLLIACREMACTLYRMAENLPVYVALTRSRAK